MNCDVKMVAHAK